MCPQIYGLTLFYFSAPDFVRSVSEGDYVFFFFREKAVEYINCGKVNSYLTFLQASATEWPFSPPPPFKDGVINEVEKIKEK